MVGGSVPVCNVITENTASTAPAAISVCPTMDLFELIGTSRRRSPSTAFSETYSILSFSGVLVPWALM